MYKTAKFNKGKKNQLSLYKLTTTHSVTMFHDKQIKPSKNYSQHEIFYINKIYRNKKKILES